MRITVRHKKNLPAAVRELLKLSGENRLFAFYGPMGSGKTTIIKVICESLGAVDLVSSPSFTIVNEYRTSGGESLYHIDFYRIKKQDEIFDSGIEEYLSAGSYCFIEWPEVVEALLPAGTVKVRISVGENEERILEFPS